MEEKSIVELNHILREFDLDWIAREVFTEEMMIEL